MRKILLSVLVGLSATVALAELAAIKDGLVYNLDASDVTTITTNELGNVVEWRAKEGMADMVFKGGTLEETDKLYYPWYETTRNSGLGAVRFGLTQDHTGNHSTWMVGAPKNGLVLTNRTVFLVWDILNDTQAYAQIWGKDGDETQAVWYSTTRRFEKKHFLSGTPSIDVSGTIWTPASGNSYFGSISSGRLYAVADTDRIYETAALGRARHSYKNVETYYAKGITDGSCTNNYYKGIISQILVYDRVLSDDEAAYMKDMLTRKWVTNAGKTILWTGAGDGVNWDDGANWKGGSVPGDGDVAEIGRNAVTVRGVVSCYDLESANASITVADGATLAITNSLKATGSTLFTVKTGAELRVNKSETFSSLAGEGATFALDGGTLAKVGGGTFKFQHAGAVSGGVLRIDGGIVDLNGFDVELSALTGDAVGVLCNSSDEAAVLKLTGEGAKTIPVSIVGNVTVGRADGDLAFANMQRYEGATALDGVKLTAGADCVPESIEGLVMHVDASRTDTLVTNAQGQVLRWRSLGDGKDRAFYFATPTTSKFEWGIIPPVWSATMMNGKPGVGFSISGYPEMIATNWLKSTATTTNRTIVAVISTSTTLTTNRSQALGAGDANSGAWDGSPNAGCFGIGVNYNTSYFYNYYVTEQIGNPFEHGDGFATINGKVVYDPAGGVTNAMLKPLSKGTAELLVMTGASAWHGLGATTSRKGDVYQIWLGKYSNGGVWGGVFSEICIYDRPLTVSERQALESHLMAKWGITPLVEMPELSDPLPPSTTFDLKGATVDLNGATQTVAAVKSAGGAVTNGTLKIAEKLETVAAANGSLGTLTLEGDVDLTDVDFILSGAKPRQGTVLRTTGRVTGPFKTVGAPDPTEVRYRTQRVIYGLPGILLFVR